MLVGQIANLIALILESPKGIVQGICSSVLSFSSLRMVVFGGDGSRSAVHIILLARGPWLICHDVQELLL